MSETFGAWLSMGPNCYRPKLFYWFIVGANSSCPGGVSAKASSAPGKTRSQAFVKFSVIIPHTQNKHRRMTMFRCFSLYLQWIFIVWVFIQRGRLPRPFVINLHFIFHVSIKFHAWKVSLDDKCEAWRPNTSERNVADITEKLKDMKDYIGYKSQCYRDRCLKDTFNHSLFVHTRWCFCCCDW